VKKGVLDRLAAHEDRYMAHDVYIEEVIEKRR
jgi:hypothetical protein